MDNSFSIRIKELRESLGLTQVDFSEKLNIAQAALSSYENGSRNPTLETVLCISKTFNVSLDWLCGINPLYEQKYKTYKEIFLDILNLLRTRHAGDITSFVSGTYTNTAEGTPPEFRLIFKNDRNFENFFREYDNMTRLLKNKSLPKRAFDLWLEDALDTYNHIIDGNEIVKNDLSK